MKWTSPEGQPADGPIHCMPIGDIRDHVADGLFCPCMPRLRKAASITLDDGTEVQPDDRHSVIVHNSYDGREIGEVCRSALDALGKALADHEHQWTDSEREEYEHAIDLLNMHYPKEST